MTFKIAIASGKGGTGKTTVAANIYRMLSIEEPNGVQLVDCDVEEPNDLIFFSNSTRINQKKVNQLIPRIDQDKCTFCKKCIEYCEFNAISIISSVHYTNVNSELCHSCGACSFACNYGAISEYENEIGEISIFDTGFGNGLIEGKLKIGSPMQTAVIKATKEAASKENKITIYDAPPGTSCPVVETMSDADYVVLVTEPTPFGLNDLKLAIALAEEMGIPFGVVINKAGLGNNEVFQYLQTKQVELLAEIPFDKSYASNYSTGNLFNEIPDLVELAYMKIIRSIKTRME